MILSQLIDAARRDADARRAKLPVETLRAMAAASRAPRVHPAALLAKRGIIAEVKRRSPSRGETRPGFDPAAVGAAYASAGASAISVLTDMTHFGGSLEDLTAVRAATASSLVPILRKDFVLDEAMVLEARAFGASLVLLIARVLEGGSLARLVAFARECSLEPLVEVHTEREADRALAAGAQIVGVNARDLDTLKIDPTLFARVASRLPAGIVKVAESGVRSPHDAQRHFDEGADLLLVGDRLSGDPDPAGGLRALLSGRRQIKVCGLARVDDALAAAEAGADCVGFVFADSPRRADPAIAAEARKQLPPEVRTVAVFRNQLLAEVAAIAAQARADVVQLHGTEPASSLSTLKLPVLRAVRASSSADLTPTSTWGVRRLLIDTGDAPTPEWIDPVFAEADVWLAGGLTPENVGARLARFPRAGGVDVARGVEQRPGTADIARIRAFVQEVRRCEP